MRNRGFSLIELIVVVAIMAVLAGFLAPALIRYINKSRLSTDIDTGREIAMAIVSVVADDAIKDNAVEHATPQPVEDMDGSDFKKAVYEILSVDEVKGKSKKDADGNPFSNPAFYYTLDSDKNKVEVFYGGITEDYEVYPVTGSEIVK